MSEDVALRRTLAHTGAEYVRTHFQHTTLADTFATSIEHAVRTPSARAFSMA
jgi:hypothetical protein